MKNPLGVSPSKGYQGTTRGKEKILMNSYEPTQINWTKVRLLIQTSNLISRSTVVPNTFAGKLINIVSGSVKNIYQIIMYALSSAHEKFGV